MVIAILHEREIFTKYLKWIHLINHDIYSFSCLLVNNHFFGMNFCFLHVCWLYYSAWKPGEPNNSLRDEQCGEMNIQGKLNDQKCDSLNPFICEQYPRK